MASGPAPHAGSFDDDRAKFDPGLEDDLAIAVTSQWIPLPAGTFRMGSPDDELGRFDDEHLHEVSLTRGFEILSTEVTRSEYERVMDELPHGADTYCFEPDTCCGPDCPVTAISWRNAAHYCNALSLQAGLDQCYTCNPSCSPSESYPSPYDCPGYRLPTEAEWEYAARAGTAEATYNGDLTVLGYDADPALDPIAWHPGNARSNAHAVGTRQPNAFGLYDMLGNVAERCGDTYQEDLGTAPVTDPFFWDWHDDRLVRGSSWNVRNAFARAAGRWSVSRIHAGYDIGFRPVRTLPPTQ